LKGGTYKAVLSRDTGRPWPSIAESESFTVIDYRQKINAAIDDIEALIRQDRGLGPKFCKYTTTNGRKQLHDVIEVNFTWSHFFKTVRLGFHDCVGGCDGCVDMANPDNFGLEVPIAALDSVVTVHEDPILGISRADIWALATLVGADVSQPFPVADFSLNTVGRINCEDAGDPCFDAQNVEIPCTQTQGPTREIPHADITTADLFHFFSTEFGFNMRETVALFGAHTIGVLTRENSGFDGPDGWVVDDLILDNDYYFELVGNPNPNIPFADQVDVAPPWFRDFEDNSDLEDMPDRHVWAAFPQGRNGQRILMLNADIALVRNLTEDNMADDGEVSCDFIGEGRCPHAIGSLEVAAEYRLDNELWLTDFADVLHRMLDHGYVVDNTVDCVVDVCFLTAVAVGGR
jgi:hypothetical protein